MGLNNWFGGMLMKQYMSATRLVTKLKMLRSGKKDKSFLVVEGITDFRLYSKFIDPSCCEVIIADSKQNVEACIKVFNEEKALGILGITDRDFDGLEPELEVIPNVFVTDGHDLECMLIKSNAFENICIEYGDKEKYMKFESHIKMPIRDYLIKQVALIGYLRWYSLKEQLGLRFSNLEFEKFIDTKTLEVDLSRLIDYVLFGSKKAKETESSLISKEVKKLKARHHDEWQVCCGHDLMVVINLGLMHVFGNYNAKNLFPGQLEGNFRLAYTKEDFKQTQLYKQLVTWENKEQGYYLFKK